MKRIKLGKGYFAIVDDEDYERVKKYSWIANTYRADYISVISKKFSYKLRLSRFIMKYKGKLEVDHINLDPLDNRKENLRLVTRTQNNQNRRIHKNNKSGYKGVYSHGKNKWAIEIKFDGKKIKKCSFSNPITAAKEYDRLALKYHGEFAKTNF